MNLRGWLGNLGGLVPGLLLTSICHADPITVAQTLSTARASDGNYISWCEHIIDDPSRGTQDLSGSDGLAMADLDADGFEDIVSVHESDTVYDGKPVGHVRIAWGSDDPQQWTLGTLAAGPEAAAAEDVSIADVNGDGFPDVLVACELAHLIYFENPGENIRDTDWQRVVIPLTQERGSYIRTFLADFDGDGRPEAVAANKGEQNPALDVQLRQNISLYLPGADPLDGMTWREQLLGKVVIPINSEPVDLDGDGRKDIVANAWPSSLVWLQQPASPEQAWPLTLLGGIDPDQLVSVRLGDLDGDLDVIGTRGNSEPYDGVIWLEQLRTQAPQPSFQQARHEDSEQMPLP